MRAVLYHVDRACGLRGHVGRDVLLLKIKRQYGGVGS